MNTFNRAFKAGKTKVKIEKNGAWLAIELIEHNRKWIKLVGIAGMFQRGHVITYTNKGGK